MKQPADSHHGFTLIEIIIALAIFAIVAVITSTVIHSVFLSRDRVMERANQLEQLQMALTLIERQIAQMIDRPLYLPNGGKTAALLGKATSIEFTHTGLSNPLSIEPRSHLQRVAFGYQGEQLTHKAWTSIEITPKMQTTSRVILTNLTQLQFRYLLNNGRLVNGWPAAGVPTLAPFPKAIHMTLTLRKWGQMKFVFPLPDHTPIGPPNSTSGHSS